MIGLLKNIFGSKDTITYLAKTFDEAFFSNKEHAKDKVKARIKLLEAYHPFRLTQRFLAIMFVFSYLFIVINASVGILYGLVDMKDLKSAIKIALDFKLDLITFTIVGFYFGGGLIESIKRK